MEINEWPRELTMKILNQKKGTVYRKAKERKIPGVVNISGDKGKETLRIVAQDLYDWIAEQTKRSTDQ